MQEQAIWEKKVPYALQINDSHKSQSETNKHFNFLD